MDHHIVNSPDDLPTMRQFQGRALVIRIDEPAIEHATLVEDVVFMRNAGVRPIVVLDWGQRAASTRLVGLINRIGGEAVSLDGTSASTMIVGKDTEGRTIVRSVNADLLSLLLEQGYIAVFSAQGTSVSGTAEPVDSIDAARELAAAMRAKRLLFPSETGGIRNDNETLIDELTSSEALALASAGTLGPEAAKQLEAAALGVRCGVDAAQLLDLSVSHAALVELLTAQHLGTQIVSNIILQ
jgi:acetylglutamate kinase